MKSQFIALTTAFLLLAPLAKASTPTAFTHQGLLRENGDLVNGTREITATIVNENGLTIATTTEDVTVVSGLYNFTIQNIDLQKAAAAEKLVLKISVDGEALEPGLKINSVPYALLARQAESLNTSGTTSTAVFTYNREADDVRQDAMTDDIPQCPCDNSENNQDCGEWFQDQDFNVKRCYDQWGPVYYIYTQDQVVRPLDAVVIENNAISIGTTVGDAPLHILSDAGEADDGAALHIVDVVPRIALENQSDQSKVLLSGENGALTVQGGLEADYIGDKLWAYVLNRIYPVGSIYTTTELSTAQAVEERLGGKWLAYGAGNVLLGAGDGYEAGSNGGTKTETYQPKISINETALSTDQMPSHTHSATTSAQFGYVTYGCGSQTGCNPYSASISGTTATYGSSYAWEAVEASTSISSSGGGKGHTHSVTPSTATISHMQPYIVVYMYKRIY